MEKTYKELCAKMLLPDSENLANIWKILCDPAEAELALLLPGHPDELSEKTGRSADETAAMLDLLYKKGVIFKSKRGGITSYKLAKNLTQLHDASIVWEGADQEMFDLWKNTLDVDMTALLKSLPENFTMPTTLRVIPVDKTIEPGSSALRYEECVRIAENADKIAVVKCPCRLSQQNCSAPVESCIQINRGAEYALDRGHGRAISKDEAVKILTEAAKAGLVHVVENRETTTFICNCCECCCESLRVRKYAGKDWILAPSRFLAAISGDECISCGDCIEICPFEALAMNESDIPVVDEKKCLGCGLCAGKCLSGAIVLKSVRPEDHIPLK